MQMSQIHKKTIKMGTKDNKEETNRKIENKKEKNKIAEGIKKGMETTRSIPRRIDLMNNKTRKK